MPVAPEQESIAPFHSQRHLGAGRQAHLGRLVAEWQSGEHRRIHLPVPEANATRHRVKKSPSAKGYDRSRIHLDRPKIKIASRDFH